MPFKGHEALKKQNYLAYPYNGQVLKVWYNAGEKYAKLEELVDEEKLDRIGEDGVPDMAIPQLRSRLSELLCMVIEKWDYKDENGEDFPIDAEKLAAEGHPLEFYSGLSTAISQDYAKQGGGTKSSS